MKAEILAGTIIHNRYRIQTVLGRGGLGRTYLALDTHRFDERCVLKEFSPTGLGEQSLQKARDLFYREAKILYQIKHAQIPEFFAYFEEDERLFLVQEYIDGKTCAAVLHDRLTQQQTFSEAEVFQLLEKLLPVLNYVHRHGIIHRDVSADNIMLADGLPILIDFGVGTQGLMPADGYPKYDSNSSFVGKFGYAPYEQLRLGQSSPNSDLYALAVTAIVLLTGQQPLQLINPLVPLEQWRSGVAVSDRFAEILSTMLNPQPEKRYQSATAVLAALSTVEPQLTALPITQAAIVPDTSLPPLPGGAIATRPLHFIWICDCSNSMSVDGKIQALNTAIAEVIPHMQAAAADNPNAQIFVRAIQFSTGAQWRIAQPTPIDQLNWTDLTADGITDLGAALHLVAEQLKSPPMSNRALPPVLVLISDGQPTDDYLSGLNAVLSEPWGRKAIRVAIAIGRDADYDVLQQFIGHPDLRPLRANNPEALVRQIKWASTAVLKAASAPASVSKDGSIGSLPMPLANPPTPLPHTAVDNVW